MALTTEARKPFYAYVGVVDLAVENIKELPTGVVAKASTFVPKTTSLVSELPAKVRTELPAKAKELRGQVETRTTDVAGKATALYGELATRGEKFVASIRRAKSTQVATDQVKSAQSKVKAAGTSTAKAAKATAKAVEDAAEKLG